MLVKAAFEATTYAQFSNGDNIESGITPFACEEKFDYTFFGFIVYFCTGSQILSFSSSLSIFAHVRNFFSCFFAGIGSL